MHITLAITTYERPDALAAVLATALDQDDLPSEILVADDGSGAATRAVFDAAARRAPASLALRFVGQAHAGFRLTRLRNLAIAAARGDYIVFVDGDMLLHRAFVADHRRAARPGHFVQGVRVPLAAGATRAMLAAPGRRPRPAELAGAGLRRLYALHAPALQPALARLAGAFIAVKGCNQGFWRADLVRANGFNEAIEGWGPEDKELCARLEHAGVGRRTLLLGGIAWHLDHAPAARDRRDANEAVLAATLATRDVRCARGLDGHLVL
jgi:glycosyltransferase involved in cell wall biosynthesis